MAATGNQKIKMGLDDVGAGPVAALTILYQGTMCFQTVAGYLDDDTGSGANRFAGVVVGQIDNSGGAAGDLSGEFYREGEFELPGTGFTQADVGKDAYATDNFTVQTVGGGSAVRIGKVERYIDSTHLGVLIEPEARKGGNYAATAAGTALTGSSTATILGSTTIPANTLKVGDVIRVRAQITNTAGNSTDTLTMTAKIGSTTIKASVAFDVTDGGGDIGYMDFDLVIRTIGASGTFVAAGVQAMGVPDTVTAKPFFKASTAIDTTADQVLAIYGTWSTTNGTNSCRLDVLNVQKLAA